VSGSDSRCVIIPVNSTLAPAVELCSVYRLPQDPGIHEDHGGCRRGGLPFVCGIRRYLSSLLTSIRAHCQIPHNEFIAGFRDIFVDVTGTINIWATWEQGELQLVSMRDLEPSQCAILLMSPPETVMAIAASRSENDARNAR
jgi:hypothetical protein